MRRPLWRVVAPVLVGTAVTSLVVIAGINYVVTDDLVEERATEQLVDVQRALSRTIADGLERQRQRVALLAADRSVAASLVQLRDAVIELDDAATSNEDGELLTAQQTADLTAAYGAAVDDPDLQALVTATGLDVPTVAELVPGDAAGRYLQYHYTARVEADERAGVSDPGDGSTYSAVHADVHPTLREQATLAGAADLLLVDAESGRIVYSVRKGPDFGVDAVNSVIGAGGLGEVLTDALPRALAGEAVFVDLQAYLGTIGRPEMFLAASVRDGREVVGTLVTRLDLGALTTLMTAGGRWNEVGLGDTGETYVVGRDRTLRTDLRSYVEDPAAHVAALRAGGSDDLADAVEVAGSTVLIEPVDTEPVRTALDGTTFVGQARGASGASTLSVASAVGVNGLDWVVVAEVARAEAAEESAAQRNRLLLLAAVLLPAVAAVGYVFARRSTRPVTPLVAAAEQVAAGSRDVPTDDPSRDEFGHLGRELARYAEALAAEDAVLAEEERALDELLASVLPARAVDAVRRGDLDLGDLVDTATVVAATTTGFPDDTDDAFLLDHSRELAASFERLAAEHHLERVWSSSDRHVFVAGLGRPDHGADDAVRFVVAAAELLRHTAGAADLPLSMHAGMASGTVATGVVRGTSETGPLSFGVWGEAARAAMALDMLAAPGTLLVHATSARRLDRGDGPDTVERGSTVTVTLGDADVEVRSVALPFDTATHR